MTRRPPSLFLRLLFLTLPVEAAVLALFGLWLIRGIERREEASFDGDLRIRSKEVLAEPVLDPAGRVNLDADLLQRDLAPGTRACVLDGAGATLWESPPGWFRASGLRPLSQAGLEYIQTLPLSGARYRVLDAAKRLRLPEDGDLPTGPLIEAVLAAPISGLRQSDVEFRGKAAATGVALLALTAVLLWAAIKAGLRPVLAMMRRLGEVPGPAGTERLDEGLVPRELRPLAREINGLSDRLWGLVQIEKRFTAEAAHELRTPLTLVKSTLQTALLTGGGPGEFERALREALEDLQRLEQTAESLLVLARADASVAGGGPAFEALDLAGLLNAVAERFAPAAARRGLEVVLDLRPAAIHGDRAALERLFLNLTDNAVKYSRCGGTVTLRCAAGDGAVVAAVEDGGPPVPEVDRPHLFQQFFRGAAGRAEGVRGAGLGLSIAAAMARLHDAGLTYEPTAQGGNRFAVRFSAPSRA